MAAPILPLFKQDHVAVNIRDLASLLLKPSGRDEKWISTNASYLIKMGKQQTETGFTIRFTVDKDSGFLPSLSDDASTLLKKCWGQLLEEISIAGMKVSWEREIKKVGWFFTKEEIEYVLTVSWDGIV